MITLSTGLGIPVAKILEEEYHIAPRKIMGGIYSLEFTEEELAMVKHLEIKNPSRNTLKGISYLTHLEKLSVETEMTRTAYMLPMNVTSITDEEVREIETLSHLKELKIHSQREITSLSLECFPKLETVDLVGNAYLEEVSGLDQLTNLTELFLYGNENLHHPDGLNACIRQNDFYRLRLDLLYYPDVIAYHYQKGSFQEDIKEKLEDMESFCEWKEIVGEEDVTIQSRQASRFHNKCVSILEEIEDIRADKRGIVAGVEHYLASHVVYDDKALETKSRAIIEDGLRRGPKNGTNGAYNAIMANRCVCEGYTRAMQYVLGLRGLSTHNVHCLAGEDKIHMADGSFDANTFLTLPTNGFHSIVCIDDLDGAYCDPCWDAARYQKGDKTFPYLMRTKEEIARTHTLSFEERNYGNANHLATPREVVSKLILPFEMHREEQEALKVTNGRTK